VKCYEKAHAAWKAGKMPALRDRARRFAMRYDADKILHEHWEPVLAELAPRDPAADPVPLTDGEGPAVSVCFASRGRPDDLAATVTRLLDLAAEPDRVEVIIAADPDDTATRQAVLPAQARIWVAPERYGYTRLHDYLNQVVKLARGEWCLWWNDDMVMQTQGWDLVIRKSRPAILWPRANHVHHANIVPAWPRAWSDAMGYVSPTTHMDTYLQRLGEALGRHDRADIDVVHDRADVTGNHDDQTYAEGRKLLGSEGMHGEFPDHLIAGDAAKIRALIDG